MIIFFYPAAMTPGCTKEACDFRDSLVRLQQAGYDVVGISPDAPAKLARFVEQESLTYPLLSDPDKQVMDAYGAYGEKSLYGKKVTGVIRSTVVVGPDGTVELAKYNVKATGHVASLSKALGWLSPRPRAAAADAGSAGPGAVAPYDRGCAEVVKLADTQDLGSCAFGREGSSPFFRTHSRDIAGTPGHAPQQCRSRALVASPAPDCRGGRRPGGASTRSPARPPSVVAPEASACTAAAKRPSLLGRCSARRGTQARHGPPLLSPLPHGWLAGCPGWARVDSMSHRPWCCAKEKSSDHLVQVSWGRPAGPWPGSCWLVKSSHTTGDPPCDETELTVKSESCELVTPLTKAARLPGCSSCASAVGKSPLLMERK